MGRYGSVSYTHLDVYKRQVYGTSIDERPEIVDSRTEEGHWEGDTVVGKRNGKESVILTLLEMCIRDRIQGLQIRRDNVEKRKFRWVSSADKKDGCRAEGWTHLAGEPSQNVGKSFIKSYCAVLLEGAVIVLACKMCIRDRRCSLPRWSFREYESQCSSAFSFPEESESQTLCRCVCLQRYHQMCIRDSSTAALHMALNQTTQSTLPR